MSVRFFESGEINTGSGQLGTEVTFTSVTTSFSIVPGVNVVGLTKYYDVYYVEILTNNNLIITMPSAANVPIGWSCKIIVLFNLNSGGRGTSANLTIVNDLAATIYIFSSYAYTSNYNPFLNTSVVFVLRDNTPTWIVEPNIAEANIPNYVGYITRYRNSYPIQVPGTLMGRGFGTVSVSGLDVLFSSAPVTLPINMNNGALISDQMFYNYTTTTTTSVTLLQTGIYIISLNFTCNPQSQSPNIQLGSLLNGVSLPSYVTLADTNGINGPGTQLLRAIFYATANDLLRFIAGKSVVAGVATSCTATLSIEYLGS